MNSSIKIETLTDPSLIFLRQRNTTRERVLDQLINALDNQGKLHNKAQFKLAVQQREEQGATALGEGLAVPHGKSNAVKQASFAVATLEDNLLWEGVDGDEKVNIIILLAIPESEAGSTHMQILTQVTTALVDNATRQKILDATDPQVVIELLSNRNASSKEKDTNQIQSHKSIVCVTACPAGIAHTYMAAEYLIKAGKKLGVIVYVEKQGANGVEDPLTPLQLNEASACIIAAEVAIKGEERFANFPLIKVPVAEPIRHAEKLIQEVLEKAKNRGDKPRAIAQTEYSSMNEKQNLKTELKQALLSGISFAVPLIVAGGTVLAVAVLLAQIFNLQDLYNTENSWLWMYRKLGGNMLGTLMVPVLAAYTAYSLADKPALGPGFAAGIAANMIGAGFLGGIAGGLIAGYLMRWVKTNIRLSPNFNGFLTYYLYPVIGTLVAGSLMLFVIGKPVAYLNVSLTEWLNGLSGSNAILLGMILGFFVSFDLGGPVNKAAYAFCLGAMANGVYGPYAIFGSVKMVSAFTVTAATVISPKLFQDFEIETGKSTWLLGLAGITEGAIPMAIEDPLRVIGSFLVGSIVTGAIIGASGIGLSTPGAGIFSLFLLQDNDLGSFTAAAIWLGAALIGTLLSTITLLALRNYAYRNTNRI